MIDIICDLGDSCSTGSMACHINLLVKVLSFFLFFKILWLATTLNNQ